ncbi:hypothetical protein CVT26_007764, partial [Gymnopilus dilepis]
MVNGADRTTKLKRNNPHSSRLANIVVHPPSHSSRSSRSPSPERAHSNSNSSSYENASGTPTRVTGLQTPLTPNHTYTNTPGLASSSANTALRSRLMSLISPRSSNYERLEGGHGPARTGPPAGSKRLFCGVAFGWKKFAVVAAIIVGGVWLFGPREGRVPWR